MTATSAPVSVRKDRDRPAARIFPAGLLRRSSGDGDDRPLFDAATIVDSVWKLRYIIIATTVLGGIGGALLAASMPSLYVAESKLYVDPREVRLTDSDLSKGSLATEAILALVDSQLEVLRSRAVLEKVAIDMGLDRDAEFGTRPAGSDGLLSGLRNLFSSGKPEAVATTGVTSTTLEKLSSAVSVGRDPKTFVVTIDVKSQDPAKSALIANRIVTTFLSVEQSAQSGFFQRTTAALDTRLADLRTELDKAENAVEKYKAENDIVGASGELISDKQLLTLNDQVSAVRSRIADASAKVAAAANVQMKDVLSGAFPEEVASVTLQELRKQYSNARAQLGSLETSLGPRHPQRIAAAQAVEVARVEIGNELRRLVATQQTELQRATRTEQDLLQQLNVQKSRNVTSSTASIELRELERKAAATRTIYESFLKRASETGEEEKLTSRNIRVISTAEPPLQPVGPPRKLIAIGGVLLGFIAGLGLGILLGLYRSVSGLFVNPPEREADKEQVAVAPVPQDDPPPPRPMRPIDDRYAPVSAARPIMPSAHHTAASTAALSAFPARLRSDDAGRPEQSIDDPGVAQVQSDLRTLRHTVERYARQRSVNH